MKQRSRNFLKYFSILALIFIVSAFHYETSTEFRYLHEIYQRLYYIPILLAAYWYGPLRGVLAALLTSLLYIRHIHNDWSQFPDYSFNQYAEIFLYHVLALIIGFLSKKDRKHRILLEKTSQELSDAYQKLRNTFEQLRKADRLAALGQLSAGIAHEIRNPLGSIKGSIEILEKEISPDSERFEFVQIIKEEVKRLNSIVESFLKFARPPKPRLQSTSINDLVESTLILLKKRAQEGRIEIRKELSANLPAIDLDRDQMRQVLLNVVLNSSDSMPDGGMLEIKTGMGNSGRHITVDISDSGVGISDEELNRIFDPFFTTKAQGTGLGLSISHQLIQNHGGTITAQKNKYKGLTFHIELPLAVSEANA
jgi:signal transduction histidine kinase